MTRLPFLTALAVAAAASVLTLAAGEPAAPCDVLIIHAAGTPSETADKFTPENVDAVSCPTPEQVKERAAKFADEVAALLKEAK